MKTAKELFEELGYTNHLNYTGNAVWAKTVNSEASRIALFSEHKIFRFESLWVLDKEEQPTAEEEEAILQQKEELGWL